MKYPVRCKIVDVTGLKRTMGGKDFTLTTPEISKLHIGKEGFAKKDENGFVRIKLDDGNILWGHECWWVPINTKPKSLNEEA